MIDEQQRRDDDVAMPGDLIGRLQVIRERGFETMDSLQTTGVRTFPRPYWREMVTRWPLLPVPISSR